MESGYFLDKNFFTKHLTLILLYACVGTLLNVIAISVTTFWIGKTGVFKYSFSFLDCMLFGSMISAVDPVAVLSLFDEMGMNEMLYMLAIGESVLCDSVSIVLYNILSSMNPEAVHSTISYIFSSLGKLCYLSIIGVIIGVLFGCLGSIATRFTVELPMFEPLIVLVFCFASYYVDNTLIGGGVMSLLFCAIFMNRYVEFNICKKSHTALKYTLRTMGSVSEDLIFTYMGIFIILHTHVWDVGFIAVTLVSVFSFRFIVTFSISLVYNWIRKAMNKSTTSWREQCILSYSGLRSISFVLALLMPVSINFPLEKKNTLVTTTIVVCCVSIFLQGSSIRPLMNLLFIKKDVVSPRKISEGLQAEGVKLKIEEKEIENALRHSLYLESTSYKDMDVYNEEREEFEEVNTMIEEKIMWSLLDEIEELNDEITAYNIEYINTEGLSSLVEEKKDVCEEIQLAWRKHLTRLGMDRCSEASQEIKSTFDKIRDYLVQRGHDISRPLFSQSSRDIEIGTQTNGVPVPSMFEDSFLFDLFEAHGLIQKNPRDENYYLLNVSAQDDRFLYYIQRLLQEENIRFWIDQTNEYLSERKFSKVISLLKVLRYEIHRQQEIRSAEAVHLRKIDFAYNVFSIGVDHALDAVKNIVGNKHSTWKKLDVALQKLCLRKLRTEELSLLQALDSMMKFEVTYSALNSFQIEQEDSDRLMKEIEEQQRAVRLIQESTMNESVNYARIIADTDPSIFRASKEFDTLLKLEQRKITDEEFNRLKSDPDLLSLTTSVEHGNNGTDDQHEQWVHKLRRASIQYERDLADYEGLIKQSTPKPSPRSTLRSTLSPSIFTLAAATRGNLNEATFQQWLQTPAVRRRYSWNPNHWPKVENRTPLRRSSLQDRIRSEPPSTGSLLSFTFPNRSIHFEDIPSHQDIETESDSISTVDPADWNDFSGPASSRTLPTVVELPSSSESRKKEGK